MKKIELAPQEIVERFQDIVREIFEVIEMSYDDCLITDESCLCDVITEETPDDYRERFHRQFGFELPDVHIRIANLVREIAQRRRDGDAVH